MDGDADGCGDRDKESAGEASFVDLVSPEPVLAARCARLGLGRGQVECSDALEWSEKSALRSSFGSVISETPSPAMAISAGEGKERTCANPKMSPCEVGASGGELKRDRTSVYETPHAVSSFSGSGNPGEGGKGKAVNGTELSADSSEDEGGSLWRRLEIKHGQHCRASAKEKDKAALPRSAELASTDADSDDSIHDLCFESAHQVLQPQISASASQREKQMPSISGGKRIEGRTAGEGVTATSGHAAAGARHPRKGATSSQCPTKGDGAIRCRDAGQERADDASKYSEMSAAELKKAMSIYGLKPGSKPYMVQKLSQIWAAMHAPGPRAPGAGAPSRTAGAERVAASPRRCPSRESNLESLGSAHAAHGKGDYDGPGRREGRGGAFAESGVVGERRDMLGSVDVGSRPRGSKKSACTDAGKGARGGECKEERKLSKDAETLSAAVACLAGHPIMDRILLCECLSFGDVASALQQDGVKMSKRLLGHLLDHQGITHLGVSSGAVAAGGSATTSAAEEEDAFDGHAGGGERASTVQRGAGRRGARRRGGKSGGKQLKRARYG